MLRELVSSISLLSLLGCSAVQSNIQEARPTTTLVKPIPVPENRTLDELRGAYGCVGVAQASNPNTLNGQNAARGLARMDFARTCLGWPGIFGSMPGVQTQYLVDEGTAVAYCPERNLEDCTHY